MEHTLMIVKRSLRDGAQLFRLQSSNRHANNIKPTDEFGNSNRRRLRVNAVYVLLVGSIFFTALSAIATCIEIRATEQSLRIHMPVAFNAFRFCSFTLLAVTSLLALVTIVRKDNNNEILLAQLESANKDLEFQVHKRTKQLAEAINAKDHFLAIATHDLKAPISGILGLVELLKVENKNRSADESEYLAHMEYSCKKMQALISDVLEINRIEQGHSVLKRHHVDLLPLLRKIRYEFITQAVKKNIDLLFIENVDIKIETDPDTLSRILENLLSNAIKFSPPLKKVSMHAFLQNGSVIFEVSDEGPGIAPEEQPRLFHKFQRLSNRPTSSETSTGLGLSIVKQLTTQLGGEVAFRTEVGKGTTFVVTFPV